MISERRQINLFGIVRCGVVHNIIAKHEVKTIEHHFLRAQCPACGRQIVTEDQQAIKNFEQGFDAKSKCGCGVELNVLGKSRIVLLR